MKIDAAKLNRAIQKGFEATVKDFADQCTAEIEDEQWQWDGITYRQNGQVVDSPRDIVDRGELRDSQQVSVEGNKGSVEYTADHSLQVHEGSPADNYAARPFTLAAKQSQNWNKVLAKNIKKNL